MYSLKQRTRYLPHRARAGSPRDRRVYKKIQRRVRLFLSLKKIGFKKTQTCIKHKR